MLRVVCSLFVVSFFQISDAFAQWVYIDSYISNSATNLTFSWTWPGGVVSSHLITNPSDFLYLHDSALGRIVEFTSVPNLVVPASSSPVPVAPSGYYSFADLSHAAVVGSTPVVGGVSSYLTFADGTQIAMAVVAASMIAIAYGLMRKAAA